MSRQIEDLQRTLNGIQLQLDDKDKEQFFLRYKRWPEPLVSLFYRVSKPFRKKPNLDSVTVTVDGHMSFPMAHLEHVDPKTLTGSDISKWPGLKKASTQPEEKTLMQVNVWPHAPRSDFAGTGQVWVEEFTAQRIMGFVKGTPYTVDIKHEGVGPDGVTMWVQVYGVSPDIGRKWRDEGIKGEQK